MDMEEDTIFFPAPALSFVTKNKQKKNEIYGFYGVCNKTYRFCKIYARYHDLLSWIYYLGRTKKRNGWQNKKKPCFFHFAYIKIRNIIIHSNFFLGFKPPEFISFNPFPCEMFKSEPSKCRMSVCMCVRASKLF